jgi:hypothetical protein
MLWLPVVEAAGGISTSTSSLSITEGSSKTFTIKANNAAGRIDISSSNTGVATVSASSAFLDNNSVTITVKGKKVGTAKVTIKYTDVATYDGDEVKGSKTISIKVVAKAAPKPTTPTKPTTPVKEEPKEETPISVKSIRVVGYDFEFKEDVTEYEIEVYENVSALFIKADSNAVAAGVNEVSIKDKDEILINFSKGTLKKEYKIKINRIHKQEGVKAVEPVVIEKEVIKKEKLNSVLIVLTIILAVLSLILMITNFNKSMRLKKLKVINNK